MLAVRTAAVVLDRAALGDAMSRVLQRGKEHRRGEQRRDRRALQIELVAVVDRERVRDDGVLVDATATASADLADFEGHGSMKPDTERCRGTRVSLRRARACR